MQHVQAIGRDHRELVVVQIHDLVGVADERRGVAGDVVLAVADADTSGLPSRAAMSTPGQSRNMMPRP